MKKKLFSILLALSLAALTSCGNAQAQTEQTTERTTNPAVINVERGQTQEIIISAGGAEVTPFYVLRYTNSGGVAADGLMIGGYPTNYFSAFEQDRKSYPVIYCNSLDEIKFFVDGEERTGIKIHLFNEDGIEVDFTGKGTYYAYVDVYSSGTTETGEQSSSSYGAFFTIKPVPTQSKLIIDDTPFITLPAEDCDMSVEYSAYVIPQMGLAVPSLQKETIESFLAKALCEELEKMTPNGKKAEALSDKTLEEAIENYSISAEIRWLQTDSALYRITSDGKIALVETHLGEGEYLDFDADFLDLLEVILDYYPNDTYIGTVRGTVSNSTVNLRHVCNAESRSNIDVNIVSINVDVSTNYYVFTLELTSETEQNVTIYYNTKQTGCVVFPALEKEVSLKAGIPQTVTFEYTASSGNSMKVKVGNCIIEIR